MTDEDLNYVEIEDPKESKITGTNRSIRFAPTSFLTFKKNLRERRNQRIESKSNAIEEQYNATYDDFKKKTSEYNDESKEIVPDAELEVCAKELAKLGVQLVKLDTKLSHRIEYENSKQPNAIKIKFSKIKENLKKRVYSIYEKMTDVRKIGKIAKSAYKTATQEIIDKLKEGETVDVTDLSDWKSFAKMQGTTEEKKENSDESVVEDKPELSPEMAKNIFEQLKKPAIKSSEKKSPTIAEQLRRPTLNGEEKVDESTNQNSTVVDAKAQVPVVDHIKECTELANVIGELTSLKEKVQFSRTISLIDSMIEQINLQQSQIMQEYVSQSSKSLENATPVVSDTKTDDIKKDTAKQFDELGKKVSGENVDGSEIKNTNGTTLTEAELDLQRRREEAEKAEKDALSKYSIARTNAEEKDRELSNIQGIKKSIDESIKSYSDESSKSKGEPDFSKFAEWGRLLDEQADTTLKEQNAWYDSIDAKKEKKETGKELADAAVAMEKIDKETEMMKKTATSQMKADDIDIVTTDFKKSMDDIRENVNRQAKEAKASISRQADQYRADLANQFDKLRKVEYPISNNTNEVENQFSEKPEETSSEKAVYKALKELLDEGYTKDEVMKAAFNDERKDFAYKMGVIEGSKNSDNEIPPKVH